MSKERIKSRSKVTESGSINLPEDFDCEALVEMIEDSNSEIFHIFTEFSNSVVHNISKSKIPQTGMTLLSLIGGLSSVKQGIFSLCKAKEPYSIKALYRVFIEHFLKVNYFVFRTIQEKDDSVGKDYMKFAQAIELLAYGRSFSQIDKILELERQGKNNYEILCELKPEFKNYSQKTLHRKTEQFNYKKIVKYIVNNHELNPVGTDLLLSVIHEYSELSSYIHGGPTALREITHVWTGDKLEIQCSLYARATFNLFVTCLRLSCLTLALVDPGYLNLELQIHELWENYREQYERQFGAILGNEHLTTH